MADDRKVGAPQEDAILAKLRGSAGEAPVGVTSYVGLLGRSPKDGYWLLYLSLDMTQWVEISEADIVYSEQLTADRSPFGGLGGTQVFVKANASLVTSKTISLVHPANEPPDEFDLDVELGAAATPSVNPNTKVGTCQTCKTNCSPTCPVKTCITCATCQTHCGTCVQTCGAVGTCRTCQTNCDTCATNCGTCNTCAGTCANTCVGTCGCPPHTQQDTCPAPRFCR